jgi:heme/copper-type cytochrome/quinol oxidase subunit 3
MLNALQEVAHMPKLIRLYIVNVAIGFAVALAFVIGLVWADVANLLHLIFGSDQGPLAFFLLVMFHGVVFGGVQFAIAVMRMTEDDGGPRNGRRQPVATMIPIPVNVAARKRR